MLNLFPSSLLPNEVSYGYSSGKKHYIFIPSIILAWTVYSTSSIQYSTWSQFMRQSAGNDKMFRTENGLGWNSPYKIRTLLVKKEKKKTSEKFQLHIFFVAITPFLLFYLFVYFCNFYASSCFLFFVFTERQPHLYA